MRQVGRAIDMEAPAFNPVNMVERQLVAAANGDADKQKAFEKFVLDETLYVATPDAHPEGFVTLQESTSVKLLNVTLNDGRQAAAIFTSPDRIGDVFGEVGYLGIQGRVLFQMIRSQPAVLNPGQGYGIVWEPQAMAMMLGLPDERVIQKDTQIMLGSPADPPSQLIDRLRHVFSAIDEVDAAWLALAFWADARDYSWYFDVRATDESHERIRRALPIAVDGVDLHERHLDMIIKGADEEPGIGISIVEDRRKSRPRKGFLGRLFG